MYDFRHVAIPILLAGIVPLLLAACAGDTKTSRPACGNRSPPPRRPPPRSWKRCGSRPTRPRPARCRPTSTTRSASGMCSPSWSTAVPTSPPASRLPAAHDHRGRHDQGEPGRRIGQHLPPAGRYGPGGRVVRQGDRRFGGAVPAPIRQGAVGGGRSGGIPQQADLPDGPVPHPRRLLHGTPDDLPAGDHPGERLRPQRQPARRAHPAGQEDRPGGRLLPDAGGQVDQNFWLRPGDTIFLPDNRNQNVFVFGAVTKPGPIPMAQGRMNLLEAIATADPQSVGSTLEHVRIIRSLTTTTGELLVVDVASDPPRRNALHATGGGRRGLRPQKRLRHLERRHRRDPSLADGHRRHPESVRPDQVPDGVIAEITETR